MSIRATGTEGTTPKYVPKKMPKINEEIKSSELKTILSLGEKNSSGEKILLLKENKLPVSIKDNTPMNNCVESLPTEIRERLTPEMQDDIQNGISVLEFCKKYAQELAQNMGI